MLGDISFTKHAIEADQFFKLWHTLCGYRSWSVLDEITGKAAAMAIVVEGEYVSVQDMDALNMMASACHTSLNAYVSTQAAGLGVGATTIVGSGEAGPLGRVSREQGVHNSKVGHQAGPTLLSKTGTAKTARGRKPTGKGPGNAGRGSAPAGHFNAGASAAGRDYVDLVGSRTRGVVSPSSSLVCELA